MTKIKIESFAWEWSEQRHAQQGQDVAEQWECVFEELLPRRAREKGEKC